MTRIFLGAVASAALLITPALACETITSTKVKLSACVDTTGWATQTPSGDQEFLYFSNDETMGFAVISENAAWPVAKYREAILSNAAAAALDAKPENVTIVGERLENIGGKSWNVIEYQVQIPDGALLFQNFYYVQAGFGSSQFVYWSAPEGGTSTAFRAGQMLATVQFAE
ncbi:hypothetical protein [Devosia sp. A16]|uniref:hypothetical protein n=1 Tax=Devosia sp. A16 TaxID=1736675 RepID=UPI0006D7D1EC|nr:hypothetical protein [Devosia sp. A16]